MIKKLFVIVSLFICIYGTNFGLYEFSKYPSYYQPTGSIQYNNIISFNKTNFKYTNFAIEQTKNSNDIFGKYIIFNPVPNFNRIYTTFKLY
jgi:hypothetical protein